ncbi:MAG: exonuclease SbcCD subunit D [Firmicutes bacterium]|nr:exonuclease SbcCD subunit D [Bacillota bacterium]
MKLFHLSDLHLGKRVNEYSMLPDQAHILEQILQLAAEEQPAAVLLAGDIYDKTVPPAEAVQLFDDFLCRLAALGIQAFIISGNHDSAERIAFGGRLMEQSGVHVSPVYDGTASPVTLTDEHGPVDFYLLPFIKPAHVRRYYPEADIASYTDALRVAIEAMNIDPSHRNVLITHQFVTGATRSDSEEISVGGTDNVDASVFAPFDYVALGHIHGPQNVTVAADANANAAALARYCGTPLKYSFSEAGHVKSITVVELGEKDALPESSADAAHQQLTLYTESPVSILTLPLTPLHDLREIRGTYMELTDKRNYEGTAVDDYLHITLTDEEDIPDAISKLRVIYPNLMKLDYDNTRTRSLGHVEAEARVQTLSPLELFAQFYETQNGQPLSEEQQAIAEDLITKIWEDESL